MWNAGIACAGWLPGAVFFPLGLHLLAGPVPAGVFVHFGVIFAIVGLIALTYSYFASEFVMLRIDYAELLVEAPSPRDAARGELVDVPRRLRWFQILTGAVPLLTAALVVAASSEAGPENLGASRLLLGALILLGVIGVALAAPAARAILGAHQALTGAQR